MMALAAGVALSFAMAIPALADNTVTQTINAGNRTASFADANLTAVNYSHASQTNTGQLTLTADDSTGSDQGWNVTVQAIDFTKNGDPSKSIAASNFSITGYGAVTATDGQAVDATNGPLAGVTGALDTTRKVLYANAGYGKGEYTVPINVQLTIPGMTLAGTYTSTLTVTIGAGPGA
jgi:hypothetical protein